MKFPVLNIDGTKTDSIEISDKLVKLKVNHKLIKFVIDWQFNHAKPRTAKTKQRNEIRGSTLPFLYSLIFFVYSLALVGSVLAYTGFVGSNVVFGA